jgi:hypothetical protein
MANLTNHPIKHGMKRRGKRTREYKAWNGIIQRCTNPNDARYKDYGGRGIKVCKRWRLSFQSFFDDIGIIPPGLTLERKENNKGYRPGNVIFATIQEQSRNKRNNVWLTARGKKQLQADWARELKISPGKIHYYLKKGLSLDQIIEKFSL